jgi:putative pyruvate formate lyase activating enzyme
VKRGYDSSEALALLDGVIDIYMPDMKYGDSELAQRYSHLSNYWEVNQAAVKEMHRQVGDLRISDDGLAERGLLVRHLVLPADMASTENVLDFVAREISPNTYLNIMAQYRPCYRAHDYPPLDRPATRKEYEAAVTLAAKHGLKRLDHVSQGPRRCRGAPSYR